MAITINGDGSITGLSTGGLPDGSVDADTLATDAVTAAKLKSDAIAVGDLPSGAILQVVSDNDSAASSIGPLGGNDESSDLLVCNITPTYSNSKIMIIVNGNGGTQYDNIYMRIQKDGTTLSGANGDDGSNRPRSAANGFTHSTGSHQQVNMSACYVETLSGADTSTSIKYAMRFVNGDTASRTLYFNRASNDTDSGTRCRTASSMIVMEIAP